MAGKLEELNYEVIPLSNPSREEMDTLFKKLATDITEAIKAK